MSFSKPSNLGIIACPGGELFADEINSHLKAIYKNRFDKKAGYIGKLYNLTREEALKQLNYIDDLASHRVTSVGEPENYRAPSFKVPCHYTRFANGEFKSEILRSIRDQDIYIVQDVANENPLKFLGSDEQYALSVNDHIMILITTIDSAIQSGAKRVTLVLPTYPYSRQHKKKGREGLTASTLGRIIESLGVARIITLDIHSKEIEHTFARLALEDLHASYQILLTLSERIDLVNEDLVVVAPDTGAIDRNKYFAASLNKPLALLYKERDYTTYSKSAQDSNIKSARLLGDVKDKVVFMADDMLGTGGTLIKAMKLIREMGARQIICSVSLPLFTGNAVQHFDDAYKKGYFDFLIGTNAVCLPEAILKREWFLSANVSNLFARSISRIHHDRSISPLLDNSKLIQKMLHRKKPVDSDD
jgi:ribose-phosphate pyrophosphokinase